MTIQERKEAILAKITELKKAGINPRETLTKPATNANQETI